MDSFELNKIIGAVLATCLGVLSINIAAGAIFAPGKLAKPGRFRQSRVLPRRVAQLSRFLLFICYLVFPTSGVSSETSEF